ncbi:lipid II:glycine glycyltransferase FemX [Facklamia miroungae]|uniref:Peptidoglycan pentaglycine glycine transferase (The first glycine) n=1 Tax=Facklamia miroungae TaxID=120956 RepID=A0A1G7TAI2_9LACT|nr:peptidoglycan bridge formation glycyltransferase FemA/FemB family protein [Facklamia miroungae]NKZ29728.1 peptidoglycan bridge formation glycyltransferase FemA/FemB family protein [Facklamia miroungae]SDG32024.1 peptidoglycan pentaglycine glycine transferase (the first glycine) [Facklamia miroungae]
MIQKLSINDQEHDHFVKNHPHGDMCQLSSWGKVKQAFGWEWSRVSVGASDRVTGVASLLYKRIPFLKKSICYVSRGFVVDWFDEESVRTLLEAVKQDAKEHKAFLIKIDPDLIEETPDLLEQIESFGFEHQGYTFGFKDAAQPRFHMVTDIDKSEKDLLKSFQARTRTNIRKASKYGFELEDASESKMNVFYDIMKVTGDRDGFLIRDLSYFKRIYQEMHPNKEAKLFLVKLNPDQAIEGLERDIKNRLKEKKNLEKKEANEGILQQLEQIDQSIQNTNDQIEALRQTKEEGLQPIYLSGAIYVQCGSKAYYLYGASSNQFRDLLPNYFMQWEMMRYAQSQGGLTYDFGGVSGLEGKPEDDAPGLFEFKKRWGAKKRARIGEFDYELSPLFAKIYRLAFSLRSKLIELKNR